jgi:hypothetical protein
VTKIQLAIDDAVASLLEGSFAPTTDVNVARAQGADAALQAMARAMPGSVPQDRPGIVKHVIRDPKTNLITTVIEENATIRDAP